MYPSPQRSGTAGGVLATTGAATQSWIVAAVGLILLGATILLLTARRRRT